jgi:hypothetical protein
MKRLLFITILLLSVLTMEAQTIVSGMVKDRYTGQPLAHVSIAAEGSDVHTVTNDDGRFTLKVTHPPRYIQLSHIGYKTRRHQLNEGKTENLELNMLRSTVELGEIIVLADDPLAIVKAAMSRIQDNYAKEPELMRCFYRETARRGSRFISVAEAVTDMYKTDYSLGPDRDAVAILKGRRLMSMKASDTLGVKIQGGPVMPLMVDVAKNCEYILNPEMLSYYTYHMEMGTTIADRLHYVISMMPSPITIFPLMGGLLYIDQETLAITRAELQLDVSDWQRASDYMLVHKPFGLRFRPKELSVTVVYETDEQGITRMSYMRNEMRFNCDWKRRLFASPYTTVSEMVVTDRLKQGRDVKRPRGRSSFGIRERFYDKVEYFDDPNFWADYNIIEPTESLEHAIDKLKKKVKKAY